jgi:hypothetical protein
MVIFNVRLGTDEEQFPMVRRLQYPVRYELQELDLEMHNVLQPRCILGKKQ